MGWAIGYDSNWGRDIGYGVPAVCDAPKCSKEIDRGLGYVCGGEPYGGDDGCGLFFCENHKFYHQFRNGSNGSFCKRCIKRLSSYKPKPDTEEWVKWKLTDKSWAEWRNQNPKEVERLTPPKMPIRR